jgi:hypothetical protein
MATRATNASRVRRRKGASAAPILFVIATAAALAAVVPGANDPAMSRSWTMRPRMRRHQQSTATAKGSSTPDPEFVCRTVTCVPLIDVSIGSIGVTDPLSIVGVTSATQ